MYQKILVGCDGTDRSEDALALAAQLAKITGASLMLASVTPRVPGYFSLERQDELHDEAEGILRDAASRLPATVSCTSTVLENRSPARGLVELAEAENADAIVLGSCRHGALGRVLVGSVGQEVLDGAPCAVVTAPAEYRKREQPDWKVMAVGLDGEPESLRALAAAEALAAAAGSSLRLIHVIEEADLYVPEGSRAETYEAIEAAVRKHAQDILEHAIRTLHTDLPVARQIVDGPPAPALEATAKAVEIDLLVVGSRGFGPIKRVFLGSVSRQLMTSSPCALMIVPRGSAEARSSPPGPAAPRTDPAIARR